MTSYHIDFGEISEINTTPSGMLRVIGTIANVGSLEYMNQDGSIREEYVDEDVLFDEEHLISISGSPLTLFHPDEKVTPANYKKYAVGSTGTKVIKRLDLGCVDIVTIIGDEEAIRAVRDAKITDLSMGYDAQTEQISGNKYRQIKRICNHNAIVPSGRASMAKLHLDGWQQKGIIKKTIPQFKILSVTL